MPTALSAFIVLAPIHINIVHKEGEQMKEIISIISIIIIVCLFTSCATQQMYITPSDKTLNDFQTAKAECEQSSGYSGGGGGFLFGPAIIIFPVVAIWNVVKRNQQSNFETCMVAKGYECQTGCYHTPDKPVVAQEESNPDNVNKVVTNLALQGFSDYYTNAPNIQHFVVKKDSIKKNGDLYSMTVATIYGADRVVKVKSLSYTVAYQIINYDIDNKRYKPVSFRGYSRNYEEVYSYTPSDMETTTGEIKPSSALDYYLRMYATETAEKPVAVEGKALEEKQLSVGNNLSFPTDGMVGRDGNFIGYMNGTVLDTKTNLMWAVTDNGKGISWEDAKKYCTEYKGGGYTDWRMPTQDELATLYDVRINGINSCNLTRLIAMSNCYPWASEASGPGAYFCFDGTGKAWTKRFMFYSAFRALPVRSFK
jgi:hypothetical protein